MLPSHGAWVIEVKQCTFLRVYLVLVTDSVTCGVGRTTRFLECSGMDLDWISCIPPATVTAVCVKDACNPCTAHCIIISLYALNSVCCRSSTIH